MDWTALPKIELHAHLSGSISRRCLHEVWLKKKEAGETDLADPLIEMPDGKHDYDLKTFFPLFSSYIYHLVNDLASLQYTTRSVLQDFAADGVVYLELRTTPRALPRSNLSKADYVAAILETIRAFQQEQEEQNSIGDNHRRRLHTNLILSIDRRNTPAEASEVAHLAAQFHNRGVVGLDLCGDPTRMGIEALQPAFHEARRLAPGLGVTLHFAEAEASGTDAELLMLLREWAPQRLGHVIHLSEAVKREVRAYEAGLGLELCLSCNVHAGMVEGGFEGHHFGEWWKVDECTVVLCTDDVGVFGSPLSNEYRLVAQHFGLSESDVRILARKGIEVIFGGEEEKQRLRQIMA
ncbi:Metallo-dependent hydrolase [Cryphonectria parasitica EP155]|uniref:Metallo-dependent hydrolase n=1 Tax=Cryphonectria parasitica (strain ATCC 38755 / EP155) TaxID=660469 RepID=A0A9P5CSJ5_CRYP1|nr:Metallo-dependent hydrolase [Cryphonectria parasitica EP155]KAF3769669.1 Metallo-dependent hydrolase [Cryphonectria parasitica EP155]